MGRCTAAESVFRRKKKNNNAATFDRKVCKYIWFRSLPKVCICWIGRYNYNVCTLGNRWAQYLARKIYAGPVGFDEISAEHPPKILLLVKHSVYDKCQPHFFC